MWTNPLVIQEKKEVLITSTQNIHIYAAFEYKIGPWWMLWLDEEELPD